MRQQKVYKGGSEALNRPSACSRHPHQERATAQPPLAICRYDGKSVVTLGPVHENKRNFLVSNDGLVNFCRPFTQGSPDNAARSCQVAGEALMSDYRRIEKIDRVILSRCSVDDEEKTIRTGPKTIHGNNFVTFAISRSLTSCQARLTVVRELEI